MIKFKTKKEVESGKPSTKKEHYTGELYPEIFSHTDGQKFYEGMPLDVAIMWLGSFRLDSKLFTKVKCPICKKDEVLIPYMCGGSILSGNHTIQFYCTNCHEQLVTNDYIEYFRKIYKYVRENKDNLKQSPKFLSCTKV